jgi:NADH-quinone oxidoreductase subunit E
MLTEQEKLEIDEATGHLFDRQSGSIEALKVVQGHRRWVSDEALRDLALYLDMTPAELDSVATYYNLIFRKPVGEHVILACDSISCWLAGGERVMDYLQRKLGITPGETTKDNKFTLLPTSCLGHCEQGPAMMLDDLVIGNLTEEKIDKAIGRAVGS